MIQAEKIKVYLSRGARFDGVDIVHDGHVTHLVINMDLDMWDLSVFKKQDD